MKKLFSTYQNKGNIDLLILITRVVIGVLMLVHGLPKLMKFIGDEPVQFASVFGMSADFSLALAVFAEVGCSLLIIFGFATRLAVVPLIITMLVAVLHIHAADPFAKQELGIHYLLVYVVLFVTGSGRYSVDHLIERKQTGLLKAGA
jgi:putative oxidoreductase